MLQNTHCFNNMCISKNSQIELILLLCHNRLIESSFIPTRQNGLHRIYIFCNVHLHYGKKTNN